LQRKRRYATQIMRKKTSSGELPLSPSKKGNIVKFLTYIITIIMLGIIAYYIYVKSQPDETVIVEKEIPEKTDVDDSAQPESTPPLEERTQVEILNGCGGTGVAKIFEAILRKEGFDVVNTDNYVEDGKIRWDVPASRIIDLTGNTEQAEIIAEKLGIAETHVISQSNPNEIYDVRIIIGKDFKELESFKSFSR
jgi:hypothetical protein